MRTYTYQEWWKLFLQASRSFANPPETRNPLNNLGFKGHVFDISDPKYVLFGIFFTFLCPVRKYELNKRKSQENMRTAQETWGKHEKHIQETIGKPLEHKNILSRYKEILRKYRKLLGKHKHILRKPFCPGPSAWKLSLWIAVPRTSSAASRPLPKRPVVWLAR